MYTDDVHRNYLRPFVPLLRVSFPTLPINSEFLYPWINTFDFLEKTSSSENGHSESITVNHKFFIRYILHNVDVI